MTIDPADDSTFWYSTEYLKSDGTAPLIGVRGWDLIKASGFR